MATYTEMVDRFEEFLREAYEDELGRAEAEGEDAVVVDFSDLERFNSEFADTVVEQPEDALAAAEEAVGLLSVVDTDPNIRFQNLPERTEVKIRDLRSKHIGKMVAVEGLVKRASEVRPEVVSADFECQSCGDIYTREQDSAKLKSPYKCDCGNRKFEVVDKDMVDVQGINIEENPRDIEGSEQPRDISVYLREDLVDPEFQKKVTPGNQVVVNGILREAPQENDSKRYDIFMQGNFVDPKETEFQDIQITEEEEAEIMALAESDDIFNRIVNSIAPSIYGHQTIKEAIALQLFGGVRKERPDGTVTRGDMHILLIGEPGTGKSQVLQYVGELAPKGKYVVGKSATGAGITATVVRDEITDSWSLEAGALVLANKGIATIDEIDKMSNEDRSSLHEAMEQQSYHPDSEILLADGRRVEVGPFVDRLMDARSDEVVDGVDCEILPTDDIRVHTVDPGTGDVEKVAVDRVSRHEAPDEFVRVTFSNGRDVLVTPEHPMFADVDGDIGTVRADEIEEGAFVPAPRKLPNSPQAVALAGEEQVGTEKDVDLPDRMSPDLAEILGFLTAEGHSYAGSSHEIGFSNQDERLLERMEELMGRTFGMKSSDAVNAVGTTTKRWTSTKLYRWFESNFPGFMHTAGEKRMPAKVLGASEEEIRRFLVGAFAGDGGVESEAMAFSTTSEGLAEDYADALAKIGVASRIQYDDSEDRWKTYVMGDAIERFVDAVVDPADDRYERAAAFVNRSNSVKRHHDVLPTSAARDIRGLRKLVGLPLTGEFRPHLDDGYGVQIETVERHLDTVAEQIQAVRESLDEAGTLGDVRQAIGWSGRQLAERMNDVTTSSLHYAEDGGYEQETREELRKEAEEVVTAALAEAEERMERLQDRCNLRYYRVTNVETVPNEGEHACDWVYDMTVEPTHTFVSQGVMLHNTISVSKANIQATLQAQTAILAAGNPKFGRFDPYEPIPEQINIGDTLLSRFDLIFPVKDKPDEEKDRKLADHVMDMHTEPDNYQGDIETELLRKYIAYGKQNVHPDVTDAAKEKLKDFYVKIRGQGSGQEGERSVPMTARQLEALIRLSEASARVRLSETVDEEDAQRAIDLLTHSLKQIGTDPETGEFDIDRIESGMA
ncbi:MAG: LAGLIDADG family homing endonuclease, partial [Candidatus Nanohaloarchaea archaeon]|nr:LAGLIDADG family homing endonuclease [Candidatus Nanohaloarchaea archaeon]